MSQQPGPFNYLREELGFHASAREMWTELLALVEAASDLHASCQNWAPQVDRSRVTAALKRTHALITKVEGNPDDPTRAVVTTQEYLDNIHRIIAELRARLKEQYEIETALTAQLARNY